MGLVRESQRESKSLEHRGIDGKLAVTSTMRRPGCGLRRRVEGRVGILLRRCI